MNNESLSIISIDEINVLEPSLKKMLKNLNIVTIDQLLNFNFADANMDSYFGKYKIEQIKSIVSVIRYKYLSEKIPNVTVLENPCVTFKPHTKYGRILGKLPVLNFLPKEMGLSHSFEKEISMICGCLIDRDGNCKTLLNLFDSIVNNNLNILNLKFLPTDLEVMKLYVDCYKKTYSLQNKLNELRILKQNIQNQINDITETIDNEQKEI